MTDCNLFFTFWECKLVDKWWILPSDRVCHGAHLKPYISANVTETDQVEIHLLPVEVKCIRWDCVYTSCRTLLCIQEAGSWSDLRHDAWERSVLILNVFKRAGFRSASCRQLVQNWWSFPAMITTVMTVSARPDWGIDVTCTAFDAPEINSTEVFPAASFPSSIRRRLLLCNEIFFCIVKSCIGVVAHFISIDRRVN